MSTPQDNRRCPYCAEAIKCKHSMRGVSDVHVSTLHSASMAVGWAGSRTLTIDRPEAAGGMGLGYSGGELLLLALGACYTSDIFREAALRDIDVQSVEVQLRADWAGDPVRAHNVTYSAKVTARASQDEIRVLIEHTDRVAEIHDSLRTGTEVRLADLEAVSVL